MADNYIQKHIQNVLVSKEQFKTIKEAQAYVQKMGLDSDFKKPKMNDNYYNFRQYNPRADEQLKTIKSIGQHTQKLISKDAFSHLRDPKVHKQVIQQKKSLYDFQPKLGANGHGIWLQQYKPEYMKNQN